MGRARLIQNLQQPYAVKSARWLIEFDLGSVRKASELVRLNNALQQNLLQTGDVLAKMAGRQATEDALRLQVHALQEAYIVTVQGGQPGNVQPLIDAQKRLTRYIMETLPLRIRRDGLRIERTRLSSEVAYWNQFNPIEVRPAWAPRLPESDSFLVVGGNVETFEVNGVQGLTLIHRVAEAAATEVPGVGALTARQVMSPEQLFFNAAILPGWQRFKPTFRSGIVEAIYFDVGRLRVQLDPASSTPLQLDINLPGGVLPLAVSDLPPDAFVPGDRVLVSFPDQTWESARVLGWLDGPHRLPVEFTVAYPYAPSLGDSGGGLHPEISRLPAGSMTRLTRLNPGVTFSVPDMRPRMVYTGGQSSVFGNYAQDMAIDPERTSFSRTISYVGFYDHEEADGSDRFPGVLVWIQGPGLTFEESTGQHKLVDFTIAIGDEAPLGNRFTEPPYSLSWPLYVITQTVKTDVYNLSASSSEELSALASALPWEIDAECRFSNGNTVSLKIANSGRFGALGGIGRIVNVSSPGIGPL